MNSSPEQERTTTGVLPEAKAGKSVLLLKTLENQQLEAQQQYQLALEHHASAESTEAMQIDAEVAEKKIELFKREHDNTGAWKRDRMGRDMSMDMREMPWERNEEGQLKIEDEDRRSHLILINMGELDRLNAVGGHALGDESLKLTAERAEIITREVLVSHDPNLRDERRLAKAYDIYRYSGHDFALNLRDVSEELAEEIRKRLSQEPLDVSSAKEGVEPVPLSASCISRADGIEILNRLDETPEQAGMENRKVLIQAMLDQLQALNDIGKVESRAGRIVDTMQHDEEAAKDLYDKFLKKSLGNVFNIEESDEPLDFEGFCRLISDRTPKEWSHMVSERAMKSAFEGLNERRKFGNKVETGIASIIARKTLQQEKDIGMDEQFFEKSTSKTEFTMPEKTRGKLELEEFSAAAKQAESMRDQGQAQEARAQLAGVEFDIEKSKRDPRTGLYGREVYFENMEAALAEGKPLTTIAIDMAFLKYFDKEGGPQTGDLAIAKTAEILDNIAKIVNDDPENQDMHVEAFRTGGDEFAFSIVGGDEKRIKEVLELLRVGEQKSGRVPAGATSKPTYRPEKLTFNYGVRSTPDPESFKRELKDAEIPLQHEGTDLEQNELAGLLVKLADNEIEIQKGFNRIYLLMERELEAIKTGERGNLNTLTEYSMKAIFGEAGKEKIKEFMQRLSEGEGGKVEMGKIRGEILGFVIDQIDEKNKKSNEFHTALDKHIEDAVRISYFKNKISELEQRIDILQAKLQSEGRRNNELEKEKLAAQEEMKAVVELRERITGAPTQEAPPSVRAA
ncbi:MAG: diguanylate cyclase [Patescibacteria group bacterium]